MIVEVDVIAISDMGTDYHAGTLKFEVPDQYFGPNTVTTARASYNWSDTHIAGGRLQFRPFTRPKNKPVDEDTE